MLRRGERAALDLVVLHGSRVMLMAGLERLWCSMPAILCVSRRQPAASGPGAEIGALAARVTVA